MKFLLCRSTAVQMHSSIPG